MVFSEFSRYQGATIPVIETRRFLIIEGYLYDKITLTKLSDQRIEVGISNDGTKDPKAAYVLATSKFLRGNPNLKFNETYDISNYFYNGVLTTICSVDDNNPDLNIEYTIIGDRVLIINTKTYKVDIINIQVGFYKTMFVNQDDNFIYFAGNTSTSYSNDYYYSYNKITKEITKSIEVYSASYKQLSIIGRHNKYFYTVSSTESYICQYKYLCDNGVVTREDWTSDDGQYYVTHSSYCMPNASKLDKYNRYYTVSIDASNNIGILCRKVTDNFESIIPDQGSIFNLGYTTSDGQTNKSRVCDDYIRKVFNLSSSETPTEEQYEKVFYYKVEGSYYNSYINSFLMSDENELSDEKYLVISMCYCTVSYRGSTPNTKILVFRRNDPENNPYDLTLVGSLLLDPLFSGDNYHKPTTVIQIDKRTLVCHSDDIYYYLKLNSSGEFEKYSFNISNQISSICYDEYNRLYLLDTNNDENLINIYSEKLPTKISINYKNPADQEVVYESSPIIKNVVVTTRNHLGEATQGAFELSLTGNAEFKDTGTNVCRGVTDKSGTAEVGIRIRGISKIPVYPKLVYNGELTNIITNE